MRESTYFELRGTHLNLLPFAPRLYGKRVQIEGGNGKIRDLVFVICKNQCACKSLQQYAIFVLNIF